MTNKPDFGANHRGKPADESQAEKLRAMLAEDTGSPDEAESMLSLIQPLNRWSAPRPTAESTAALIESLLPELPAPRRPLDKLLEWWPLLLVQSQLRVVRVEIWAASLLVMILGVVVTLSVYNPASGDLAPFAIVAPLVAAVGIAFLYDTDIAQIMELEDSTPASTRLLLLVRLTLVFGFDFALALVGSIALAAVQAEISLWPLVMSWLAPMTFLSALAFLLSVASGDTMAGILVGFSLWGMHVILRSVPEPFLQILSLPGLSAPETRPTLFVAAAVLMIVALWLAGKTERYIGESA